MYADIADANLTLAFLVAANLARANLRGAIILRANLTGADLTGVDLSVANGLTQKQLTRRLQTKPVRLKLHQRPKRTTSGGRILGHTLDPARQSRGSTQRPRAFDPVPGRSRRQARLTKG